MLMNYHSTFLDLDGWINDPQSDSEDESITTSSYYDNKDLFYDDNGENYNSNSYSADTLSYQRSKKYIEPTAEELEKQRESKKQRTNATGSQVTLSDQLYRQAKIDEGNRRLKKKIE
ncbi:unnamed protein product, partial [Rotaria sordida]